MNDITIFNHLGNNIRVMTDEQGAPWFVAKDVCAILELSNPRTSLALLDEEEKGVHSMDTLGGKQELTTINESALYSLILRSRKPEAKAFRRWVTSEVLPSIRKRGGYLTPSTFGKILSNTTPAMGPNKFCRRLLDNNFAFRNGQGKIIPMQDAVNRGILTLTERIDPAGKTRPQLLVTPQGQAYFAGILAA